MLTVRALQRRLNAQLLVEATPLVCWSVATVFGLSRVVLPRLTGWATALAAAAVTGGAWIVRKQAWTERQAAVVLDRLTKAGGLLLTLRERPDPGWEPVLQARLREARPPPLKLRRPLLSGGAAFLLAGASLLLPQRRVPTTPLQQAAVNTMAALQHGEQLLAQEQVVPPELKAELERLRQQAELSRFDAADWEAADTARDALEAAAQRQADALEKAAVEAAQWRDLLEKGAAADALAREREALEQALSELLGEDAGSQAGAQGGRSPFSTGLPGAGQGRHPGGKQRRRAPSHPADAKALNG
jgi:hypothetical protein